MDMKKFAIILSGCGFLDGAEVTEAVSTLICLDQKTCSYDVFAPNINAPTVNHFDQSTSSERNILEESSRITRGTTKDLSTLAPSDYDGLVIPGGYGVAKHLSNWATKGSACEVHHNLETTIKSFHQDSKPILAICIAPTLIAKSLGSEGITVTIGNDPETAAEIEKTGAIHENCNVDDFVTDRLNKLITTPAYMYNSTPGKVFTGISKAVNEFYEMA